MKPLLAFFLLLFSIPSSAQSKEEVLREAYTLYYSERASWLGTDILLERLYTDSVGGYTSYVGEGGKPTFIFISKGDAPRVIGSVVFDSTFKREAAVISTDERALVPVEDEMLALRKKAKAVLEQHKDVKQYNNTQFNIIPISDKKGKRVYVITATNNGGVMLFGNDYLLDFSKSGEFKKLRKLHNSLLVVDTKPADSMKKVTEYFHTHLPEYSEIMTPTDLCTMMLYEDYVRFERYLVMSAKKISIWTVKDRYLMVMDRKVWEKIFKDAEKRQKERAKAEEKQKSR